MRKKARTLIGHVDSVKGGVLTVRLRDNLPAIVMVDGRSYRVGQVGAFIRVPLGYTHLYAVCTLVGAAANPELDASTDAARSYRWLSATLFGESIGGVFERGVSQYPTFEDEVHLVTPRDMQVIYGTLQNEKAITVGRIAATSGIPGNLDLSKLITRHTAIVGSTGSGKSNLLSVIVDSIATQGYSRARVLIIDPHGEYASAVGHHAQVFRVNPDPSKNEKDLYVPYWALPFEELQSITLGQMSTSAEAAVREEVTKRKVAAARDLRRAPEESTITADSPIPFSLKQLWFDLDDFERRTFEDGSRTEPCDPTREGDPEELISNEYPPPSSGNKPPFAHPRPRHIRKQLELLKSRLSDARFEFLLSPGPEYTPDLEGKINSDLDSLVASWVGHDEPITILDVSGFPSEVLSTIVGTLIRVVYDLLFWAFDLPVSGRNQPLLIVMEEAHLFLPANLDSSAHRTIKRVAKEGRKYGIGLCVLTQRPGEIDGTVFSQCGTLIALRLTNAKDRSTVEAAMPDDLGTLSGMLPSLRTGEALVLGDAMPIPSRMRFFKARRRPRGDDPDLPAALLGERPDPAHYADALANWRHQLKLADSEDGTDA